MFFFSRTTWLDAAIVSAFWGCENEDHARGRFLSDIWHQDVNITKNVNITIVNITKTAGFLGDIWHQVVNITDPVSSVSLFLLCPVTNIGQKQMTVKSRITIVPKRVQRDTSYN